MTIAECPRAGPRVLGFNPVLATGAYTQILDIVAPDQASPGSTVSITVHIRNLASYPIYISASAEYDTTVIYLTPDYADVDTGASQSFTTSFTMPSSSVTVWVWSFYWTGTEWYQDDSMSKGIAVSAPPVTWTLIDETTVSITPVEPTIPAAAELIYSHDYDLNATYSGPSDVCLAKVVVPLPDQLFPNVWIAERIANTFADQVSSQGGQMLNIQIYEDTTPTWETDYYVQAEAATGVAYEGAVAWAILVWAAIIAACLAVLLIVGFTIYILWVKPKQHPPTAPTTYTLSGTVTDASTGKPISGVAVSVDSYSATTNASGIYSLPLVAASYHCTFTKGGYQTATGDVTVTKNTTLNISMTPGVTPPPTGTFTLSGIVKDAATSNPIAGVTVTADNKKATTDSSGNYSIPNLGAGTYHCIFTKTGYQTAAGDISVTKNTTFNVSMTPTGVAPPTPPPSPPGTYTVKGKVTDSAGVPIAGVSITLNGSMTTTASDGSYFFTGVSKGTYHIVFTKLGYTKIAKDITVSADMTCNVQMSTTGVPTKGISPWVIGGVAGGLALIGIIVAATRKRRR